MLRVNAVTQLVVSIATEREKDSVPNIYETFTNDGHLAASIAKKSLDPGATLDDVLRPLLEKFAYETFDESLRESVTALGLLLLEIKNQKDAFDTTGAAGDVQKIELLARDVAKRFELITSVLKTSVEDVDWEYVAERMVDVGKTAYEARKAAS